jgi:hypothetical protein
MTNKAIMIYDRSDGIGRCKDTQIQEDRAIASGVGEIERPTDGQRGGGVIAESACLWMTQLMCTVFRVLSTGVYLLVESNSKQ